MRPTLAAASSRRVVTVRNRLSSHARIVLARTSSGVVPSGGVEHQGVAQAAVDAAGQAVDLPFTLRVTQDAPATTRATIRTMSVNGGELTFDTHQANNIAQFTVRVKNGGGNGGAPGPDSVVGGNDNQPHTQTISAPRTAPGTPGVPAATGNSGAAANAWVSGAALVAGAALLAATRGRRTVG
ncbi:hypothetical protein ACFXBB_37210 [Streptomyces scopuliridis]|uniref:hypothetical protein n=1 Tax=Streptomyces scopuliridis TaxID=452529 RepID=UPI0036882545